MPTSNQMLANPVREREKIDRSSPRLILVVDDEPALLGMLKNTLQQYGYQVLTAQDGRQGLEIFKERAGKVDLVLLDMSMPEMNGEEVFEAMRAVYPDVVAVLSSGYDETEATFRDKGLAGFIQKPYLPRDLISKIKTVLEERV